MSELVGVGKSRRSAGRVHVTSARSCHRRNWLVLGVAILFVSMHSAAMGTAAVPAPNDIGQTMVIIVISGSGSSGTGVQMAKTAFPNETSCKAAAKILERQIQGGFVYARCIPQH
jgi:hypothetical protein